MGKIEFDGGSINAQKLSLRDFLGKTIICDDGIPRKVHQIGPSFRHKDRVVINEGDPDSKMGYFCHLLLLTRQFYGDPLPTKAEMEHASKAWNAMFYEETDDEKANRWLRTLKKLQN